MKYVLFSVVVVGLLGACGSSSRNAAEFNNALVELQGKLYALNTEIDSQFVKETWYYAPDDPKVAGFATWCKGAYDSLAAAVEDVHVPSGAKGMKEALANLVAFCKQSVDDYYLALIEDANSETDNQARIQEAFDSRFEELQRAFLDAQNALVEKYELEFDSTLTGSSN